MHTHSHPAEPNRSMLPEGWVTLPFDECAFPVKPKPSIQQKQYKVTGRFPVVDQGAKLIAGYTDDPSGVHADILPLILFGDHTRVFKFLDFPFAAGADGTKLLQADKHRVDARFLYYALRNLEVPSRGYNRHFADLKGMTLTMPARLQEQRAIASVLAIIEALADMEAKRTAILKELKAATMAKLFREGLRGEPLKQTEIGEIPESWEVVRVGDYCLPPQYGYTASASASPIGPKFLRITDITDYGVDWKFVPYCVAPAVVDKFRLRSGDLVFARIGATTGKSYLISDCPDAVFASYLIRLRAKPGLDPTYLSHFFESPAYWSQVRANKGANLKGGMSASALTSILVPRASVEEQLDISTILSTLDHRIARSAIRRDTTQIAFSSMLGLLMTGTLRLPRLTADSTATSSDYSMRKAPA